MLERPPTARKLVLARQRWITYSFDLQSAGTIVQAIAMRHKKILGRRLLAAACLIVVATACGGSDDSPIEATTLEEFFGSTVEACQEISAPLPPEATSRRSCARADELAALFGLTDSTPDDFGDGTPEDLRRDVRGAEFISYSDAATASSATTTWLDGVAVQLSRPFAWKWQYGGAGSFQHTVTGTEHRYTDGALSTSVFSFDAKPFVFYVTFSGGHRDVSFDPACDSPLC